MVKNYFDTGLVNKKLLGNIYGSSSKPSRKAFKKGLREKVWFKYMGNKISGKCYCCRLIPIHITNFEVGHNKSVYSGGSNHINNLRPICRGCNKEMRTKSIEWWKNKYYASPEEQKKAREQKKANKPTKKKRQRETNPMAQYQKNINKALWG